MLQYENLCDGASDLQMPRDDTVFEYAKSPLRKSELLRLGGWAVYLAFSGPQPFDPSGHATY